MPFTSNLMQFATSVPNVLDQGAQETAEDVRDLAKQLAPEDEGDLKATVRVLPKAAEGERTVAAGGESGPNKFVDYAIFVEYGDPSTPNYPAQPFMTLAAENIDPAFRYKALLKTLEGKCRV
jgi:hypothetical protein